jgi:hypothetical protein
MNNFEKQLNNLPKGRLSRRADLMIRQKLMNAGLKQSFFGLKFNFFPIPSLRPALAMVVILVLVFSGVTSAYAYNSDQITRASMLYPVKRGLETIESRFATTPAAQVQFHNKLAERRIAEAQFLSDVSSASTTASTTDGTTPVQLRYENEFNDTLSDADNEIDQANQQAGRISNPTELDQSLTLLSDSHLNDLDKIKAMAEGVGLEADDRTTDNIALVLDNIKNHQQRIVRAISQFNGDLNKAGEDGTSTNETKVSTTTEANSSLDQVKGETSNLQIELSQGGRVTAKQIRRLTERLNKKVDQAQSAIQNGDLNKFNGLLRATEALTNNGQHFLRENPPIIAPTDIPSATNTSDKIKAQFTPKELQQKQEEQRKKIEEQQRQETEKNSGQDQATISATTTSEQTATSSANIAPEHKEGEGSSYGSTDYKSGYERTASSSPEKKD